MKLVNPQKLFTLLLLLSVFSGCAQEDDFIINDKNEFDEYLQDEMDDQHIPALATLIFKDGEIIYEHYLGKANLSQGIDLEREHLFLLASVSKTITATALLQLYEQGRFKLDDPINDYLPFKVAIPNQPVAITFRMLLTHTSGIADGSALDDQYYYGKDSPVGLDYFLENYLVKGGVFYDPTDNFYDFTPGTSYEYSNVGAALIGLLVQEISGLNFNEYCKQYIFSPLGMVNTSWRLDEISQTIVQPYNYVRKKYEAIGHYTFTDYPNGGLRSTAVDLFQFCNVFVQGGKSNNYQLLKAETINQVMSSQIPALDSSVGLHLFKLSIPHNLWGHDGGEQGVATIMAFNPDTKIGVIVLANQGDAELDHLLIQAYQLGMKL